MMRSCRATPCIGAVLLAALGLFCAHARAGIVPCFDTQPTAPWFPWDIGKVSGGASRSPAKDAYELCSVSGGYGPTEDALRFLFEITRADFELTARLDDLSGPGLGGLDIRAHEGSVELHDAPYVRISVESSPAGGLLLMSSFRDTRGGKASEGNARPLDGSLPIFLRITREKDVLSTFFSKDGKSFTGHLRVEAPGTDLDTPLFRAGLAQASIQTQRPTLAHFSLPRIIVTERIISPRLDDVFPSTAPLDGDIDVEITGAGLAKTTRVMLAGVRTEILKADDGSVTVRCGPSKFPTRGDVEVETSTGSEVLHDAFEYIGSSFLRGNTNGDGRYDIGDPIFGLNFLFAGGLPPPCKEAADANGDGRVDLADSVWSLSFLFLGKQPPPAPFPKPGISARPYLPCGAPPTPFVRKVSRTQIHEGDIVMITGENFSKTPGENIVFFGDSMGETLDATPTELTVKVGMLLRSGDLDVSVIVDPGIIGILSCKPTKCPLIFVGPIDLAAFTNIVKVKSIPSDVLPIGVSTPDDGGGLTIKFNRQLIDPSLPVALMGNLLLPAVQNLSRGAIGLGFELPGTLSRPGVPPRPFGEWLTEIAMKLQERIGGGRGSEVVVLADVEKGCINITPSRRLEDFLASNKLSLRGGISIYHPGRPPKGQCGGFDPIFDEVDFGWCRFCELIDKCNGIEKWQYFIPRDNAITAAGATLPLANPFDISPNLKTVMYNLPAYCHIRSNGLWNQCKLRDLELQGKAQVPHFPRSAIVVKTSWRTAAGMAGKDLSKHYSYTYSGDGKTYYLTAFHFTTKDIDKWFWADFYVPTPDGFGGCQGTSSKRPSCVTGVWTNYVMCTNNLETETICGNAEFPECGVDTCMGCHSPFTGAFGGAHYGWTSGNPSNGTLGLDFLYSLDTGPAVITGGLSAGDPPSSPCN